MNNQYLIHYGVKGMKWGVRHDQPRKGRKKSLYKTSYKVGFSKTQKVLLASAAIGAAAILGTYAYRQGMLSANTIIKAGTEIQNIAPKSRDFKDTFYGVYDKKSKQHFLRNFSVKPGERPRYLPEGRNKATILKSDKDLKIAGVREMKKAFKETYKNDSQIRKMGWKNFYHRFGELSQLQREGIVENLANKGYHGFKDYNDLAIGWGDTPTIFFGSGGMRRTVSGSNEYIQKYADTGLKVVKSVTVNVDKARNLKPQIFRRHKEAAVIAAGAFVLEASMYGLSNTAPPTIKKVKKKRK